MAKVDVRELDHQIMNLNSKIENLEQQRIELKDKRDNTIRCPKCNCYWDALYLKSIKNIQRIKHYEDEPEIRPTFCQELKVFWECPDCRTEIGELLVGSYVDYACNSPSHKESVKVLYENEPSEVISVREIKSKFWHNDISWDKADI